MRDQGEELCIFHATYAGLNPMDLTISKYFGMIDRARRAKMILDGKRVDTLEDSAERHDLQYRLQAWIDGVGN